MADRPHWSTFVAPIASVIVAALSFGTTIYIYKVNQATLRPFVSVKFRQETLASLTRDETGVTSVVTLFAVVTLRNVGSTPAYGVSYTVGDDTFTCGKHEDMQLAAKEVQAVRTTCKSSGKKFIDIRMLAIHNVKGSVRYRDGFGTEYLEPCSFQIRIGEPLNAPFFELNGPPRPDPE